MPFRIIEEDITCVAADAIVNVAGPLPVIGSQTEAAVYEAAGRRRLLKARKKIGEIAIGAAAATKAFRLSVKYIIHTVCPVGRDSDNSEIELLASCCRKALLLAEKLVSLISFFLIVSRMVYMTFLR